MIPQYLVDFDVNELTVIDTDVIVIGSGIAGLFTAIKASEDRRVIMITKKSLLESNTRYAQGGIAAVISEEDSPQYHRQDTLLAGAGLCSSDSVDILVNEGPGGVQELIKLGTSFDLENGELALTQKVHIVIVVYYTLMVMQPAMKLYVHWRSKSPRIRTSKYGITIL